MAKVLVILGSPSDVDKMTPCIDTLKGFEIDYEVRCISAHRNHEDLYNLITHIDYNRNALNSGSYFQLDDEDWIKVKAPNDDYGAIIAGAGMAAALPGVIASLTTIPVIGVPLSSSALEGKDALYSIVQMPPGVPVATVAIDGAKNAALLAIQIIASTTPDLHKRLCEYRDRLRDRNIAADNEASRTFNQ